MNESSLSARFSVSRSIVIALAAIASQVFTSNAAHAQTTLTYKNKQGDNLTYTLDTDMKQSMNVGGMAINTSVNQIMDLTWSVLGKEGEKASMQQTITRFRVKMQMPGNLNVNYDSKEGRKPDGPIGAVVGPLFEAMAGAEFSFDMDPTGEVSNAKVSEKLVNAMKGNPALAQMGSMYSEDGMKSMMQQASLTLPKDSIKKGTTWTKPVTTKTPFGTMTITTTYTYQGSETRNKVSLEKIATKSEMLIENDKNAEISVKVKSADMQGTIYFDNQLGRLIDSTQTQKMVLEISAMGQTFESSQNQTIKMQLQP